MKTWVLIFCVLLFAVLQNYSIDIHVIPGEEGRTVTNNIVLSHGLDYNRKGVALVTVPENSMAWNKGLRKGDFITEVDGQKGAGTENFLQIVDGKYAPGSGNFQLYRTQERIEVKIYW